MKKRLIRIILVGVLLVYSTPSECLGVSRNVGAAVTGVGVGVTVVGGLSWLLSEKGSVWRKRMAPLVGVGMFTTAMGAVLMLLANKGVEPEKGVLDSSVSKEAAPKKVASPALLTDMQRFEQKLKALPYMDEERDSWTSQECQEGRKVRKIIDAPSGQGTLILMPAWFNADFIRMLPDNWYVLFGGNNVEDSGGDRVMRRTAGGNQAGIFGELRHGELARKRLFSICTTDYQNGFETRSNVEHGNLLRPEFDRNIAAVKELLKQGKTVCVPWCQDTNEANIGTGIARGQLDLYTQNYFRDQFNNLVTDKTGVYRVIRLGGNEYPLPFIND